MTTITSSPTVHRFRRALTSVAVLASLLAGHAAGAAEAAEVAEVAQGAEARASATPTLTRAEVIADLNLWRRAGVDLHEELARVYQVDVPAYEQALAEYQRLRNGPAYAAELARVLAEGRASTQAAR